MVEETKEASFVSSKYESPDQPAQRVSPWVPTSQSPEQAPPSVDEPSQDEPPKKKKKVEN